MGTYILYDLPSESADYTADDGASVDLSGVQFEVEGGALGEEDLEIKILDFDLDSMDPPPFIDNPYADDDLEEVDALFYIGPHWALAAGDGVPLNIEPPDGFEDGDKATMYFLGDYSGDFLSCDGEDVEVGHFEECGSAEVTDGKLVTDPITRFTWVGFVKD
jgi:hypothetical protein